MAEIKIRGLRKSFGAYEVLKGIDLDIESGELIVFVGPSGCGKSTFLRCISGLESFTEGRLEIDGRDMTHVSPSKRGIAMVFQSYALYPHMTVRENIAYPLKIQRLSKADKEVRVSAAAHRLQLEHLLDRLPRELSGGQRQRVAIGRAIVREPSVFLFDEPLSNLDASLRIATRLEIAELKRSLPRTTMIYVTHDQVEAMTLADRVVVLRNGLIEQVGTPTELYERPATQFVAGFIGSPQMNFLTGQIAQAFGAHTLGVRPEHMMLSRDGTWEGEIRAIENLGSDSFVYASVLEGQSVTIRLAGNTALKLGEKIRISPRPDSIFLFDRHGLPLPR